LAVVRSLAVHTQGDSVEAFRTALVGRLSSMGRAHGLLLDQQWRRTDLRRLVEMALQPYRLEHPRRVALDGEAIPLEPRQGLGLSLILHELATNAAKYGALSNSAGRLHLSWQIDGGDKGRRISLLWQETGGPPVRAPDDKGFGMQLIERACTYELEGEVELDYAAGGLSCRVTFPIDAGNGGMPEAIPT